MAADFEAEIKNSLRSLAAQVTALGGVVNSSEAKVSKLGDSLKIAFKQGTDSLPGAKAKVDALGQSIQKAGQAAQRFGGPLGELIGRLTGGAGMAGGLGKVAVAAGALGFALKAGTAIIDARISRTQSLIKAQEELRQVMSKANSEISAQALGAASSQGGDLRQLFNRGNVEAVDTANRISASGIDTSSNIQKGVAKAYTLTGHNEKETTIAAAQQLTNLGEMNFDEAVSSIMDDRPALKSMMATGGFKSGLTKFIAKKRGVARSGKNLAKISDELSFAENSANSPEGLIAELNKTQGSLNGIARVGQNRLFSGEASGPAQSALSEAKSPESAGMLELFNRQMRADEDLRMLIKSQGPIMAGLKDALMLIGGEGSFRNQLRKKQVAEAGAAFGE